MSAPLSEQQLAEIRARWQFIPRDEEYRLTVTNTSHPGTTLTALEHAREDTPALLAEVTRQAREVERLTAELAKYVGKEPTLAEEAQYRYDQQVRYAAALEAQICQCEPQCEGGEYLHAADCPVVPIQMQAFDAAGGAS